MRTNEMSRIKVMPHQAVLELEELSQIPINGYLSSDHRNTDKFLNGFSSFSLSPHQYSPPSAACWDFLKHSSDQAALYSEIIVEFKKRNHFN